MIGLYKGDTFGEGVPMERGCFRRGDALGEEGGGGPQKRGCTIRGGTPGEGVLLVRCPQKGGHLEIVVPTLRGAHT